MSKILVAKRHTKEYLMHKYWSRKPANILNYYIQELTNEDDIVVDPFCGSGVFVREASKLGRKSIGIDLNPTAIMISKVLNSSVDIDELNKVSTSIIETLRKESSSIFDEDIRYVVHETVVSCRVCESENNLSNAQKKGNRYFCQECSERLYFNLESTVGTKILGIKYFSGEYREDPVLLKKEEEKSSRTIPFVGDFSIKFPENRRILAFDGMETSHLFTNRNFSILSKFADEIYKVDDKDIRDVLLMILTSGSAQCSKLIAYRNAMSTGGPSWSIPGFWVPPRHLELNPIHYFNNRIKKVFEGINEAQKTKVTYKPILHLDDSKQRLSKMISNYSSKVKLIFLDPPYGDNIPYLEFSNMWNGFLKQNIDFEKDVSVSDRVSSDDKWSNYLNDLSEIITKSSKLLTEDGKLLITFNNNDIRAWSALLTSLQNNNFFCIMVNYQIPAVISSKAQKAIDGSYISDIYSVYETNHSLNYSNSIENVKSDLVKSASIREGIIPRKLALRVLFVSFIKNNLNVNLLEESIELIDVLFDSDENLLRLKNSETPPIILKDEVIKIALDELSSKREIIWDDLYLLIANKLIDYELIEPEEIRSILLDVIEIGKGKVCSII